MKELIKSEFGFTNAKVTKLNGYENINYLVEVNQQKYVLKIYSNLDLLDQLIAENEVLLAFIEDKNYEYPQPIAFMDGSLIKVLKTSGKTVICRMLSYIDGELFSNVPHTEELFASLGDLLAKTSQTLRKVKNHTIKAKQSSWNIQDLNLNMKHIDCIHNSVDRNIVHYFYQQCQQYVIPQLPEMRKSIIHNDANDWNLLVKHNKVTAIIDFGDLCYSVIVNEVAVAMTYACFDKDDPLKWACIILKSYHLQFTLLKEEVAIIYYLIAARLIASICNSSHEIKLNPNNDYLLISQKPALKLLHQWLAIGPKAAENSFYKVLNIPIENPVSVTEITQQRHAYMSPLVSLSYDKPIYMERCAFQYMYDVYGNTYLDAYNNIPQVGHSHPKVVEAGQKQMATLNTNTRYLYDVLPRYAEKLLNKFPEPLDKVFFVNSGSAASDLAMRLVKAHTQKHSVMVMEHGYHGNTQSSMDISDYKFSNKKGAGQKDFIIKATIPDTYRGEFTNNDGSAGREYALQAIDQMKSANTSIGAFISEPIVGCGGQVPLAKGYLKTLYPAIRAQGGLCISDEVQTGFGRMGNWFWGFEEQDVVPDIVIIGKPMANGHPMGAVITTSTIADSFSKGVEFFSSFGGNPVSCAIALAVLEVIEEENLQDNAKLVGDYYRSQLLHLAKKYPCIGDVRGSGLFIGIEITQDNSHEPNTKLAHFIKNMMRDRHILISSDGPYDSVLKTKPALCFTKANAKTVVDNIDNILAQHYRL